VEIFYLGQCVGRKGMDIAIRALAQVHSHPWRLTIIGSGPLAAEWGFLAGSLGIGKWVHFFPALPHAEATAQLVDADLLLLPSRFDGWGAVVNEALMAGGPVICSDRCGAKDLLEEEWRGDIFQSGSVPSLKAALERRIAKGRRTAVEQARIRKWAGCLDGNLAANYLLDVLANVYDGAYRPLPPWAVPPYSPAMSTIPSGFRTRSNSPTT
jgi:glycosyltransferase involved in cell wall biosynthesis